MEYRTLGRTGLEASVLGIGGGGLSRLGQSTGYDSAHSVAIVRQAIEHGVNLIDTSEVYGTEPIVGEAIGGFERDRIIISTKKTPRDDNGVIGATRLIEGLEASLERLRTDRIDIYHLHGVRADDYERVRDELVPTLERLRSDGKIAAIGITEAFNSDPAHRMLESAVADDCWEVMMVGFNILNQSARSRVLATAREKGIGILDMFAVRNDLHQPEKLKETVAKLIERGEVDGRKIDRDDPLGFLLRPDDPHAAVSLPDAAYRFCRDEPGIDVVLCGTSSPEHLRDNVASIERPPLPDSDRSKLIELFGSVDSVSGQ